MLIALWSPYILGAPAAEANTHSLLPLAAHHAGMANMSIDKAVELKCHNAAAKDQHRKG